MSTYKCTGCGTSVEKGMKYCPGCGTSVGTWINNCSGCGIIVETWMKYCPGCGTKLEWPKEKKARARKPRKSIKLPINPDNLKKLVRLDGIPFSKLYTSLVLFFSAGGPIISIILGHRQKKIQKWFEALRIGDYDIEEFRRYVRRIHRSSFWVIILSFIGVMVNLFIVIHPEIRIPDKSYIHDSSAIIISIAISAFRIAWFSVGIATGFHIKSITEKTYSDTERSKKYTYEFKEEAETKSTESCDYNDDEDDEEF